jgi:hypothetical protein
VTSYILSVLPCEFFPRQFLLWTILPRAVLPGRPGKTAHGRIVWGRIVRGKNAIVSEHRVITTVIFIDDGIFH